jgi:hypothetical protein
MASMRWIPVRHEEVAVFAAGVDLLKRRNRYD